jgi:DNA-binding MarR family transcriptional regulator
MVCFRAFQHHDYRPENMGSRIRVMPRDAAAVATLADARPEGAQLARLNLEILNTSVGYMLRRAQLAVFADFGETFAELNLRPGQFAALTVIDRNHGMTQSEVCVTLGIRHSNFVTVIHDLERRGLVRRPASAADRRSKALELTPAGRRVFERAVRLQRIHEARIARRLGSRGREQLLRLLARLGDIA